jgi:D-tagatose-bisphosphate aldolase class II non-catalytic subunit
VIEGLRELIERNRAGVAVALPSVCSSHPHVIEASALLARQYGKPLLVEATSNQVNQFGGYTGMRAPDFIRFVSNICGRAGLAKDQVIFGGDHLGPQAWRDQDADVAMRYASDLVKSFVEAGFKKIHLDCSEGCRGEPPQVSDAVSAERTACLAAVCEAHAPDPSQLVYVVGTEVPPPGGARVGESEHSVLATTPERACSTLAEQRRHIQEAVSPQAWSRVIGLVVQPGLEFSGDTVCRFDLSSPDNLSSVLEGFPGLSFEAHSTDYQDPGVFEDLARRHFAILKVGPALTFAYREAVYALDLIAGWYGGHRDRRTLPQVMEDLMLAKPDNWVKHYSGSADELKRLRHFGYADRIRYYWSQPEAQAATEPLMALLEQQKPERPLVEQYFASETIARAERLLESSRSWAHALISARIQEALEPYFGGDDHRENVRSRPDARAPTSSSLLSSRAH